MAEAAQTVNGPEVVSALALRLAERQQIRWTCPDKDGALHQMVDADDLSGAVYALAAYAHRLTKQPVTPQAADAMLDALKLCAERFEGLKEDGITEAELEALTEVYAAIAKVDPGYIKPVAELIPA